MNTTIKIAAMIGLIGIFGAGTAWAGKLSERQLRQENRIYQGIRSGALTHGEARKLFRQQRKIQRFRFHARADGWFSPSERRMMHRRLDVASRTIYRYKHNHRVRW